MSEIRYPRRFKSNGVDYMAGGYVEFATADSFGVWVPKTHCDSQRWNDRRKITINDAEEVVAGGVWVETFDHHKPQYEPETVAFSEVDKLRAEVERLTKERDELRNEVASIGMLLSESKSNCDELRAKLANLPTGCDYDEFVQSRKAQPNLLPNQTDTDMLHGAIGIVTEAGELLDALKKQHFYGRELNRTNVIEELGDLEFYLSLCRSAIGVTRQEVVDANVRKLELRYKERFTREEAESRDTKAEAEAIEAVVDKPQADQRNADRRIVKGPSERARELMKGMCELEDACGGILAGGHEQADAEWPEVYATDDGRTIVFNSKDDRPRSVGKNGDIGCSWRHSEALFLSRLGQSPWRLVYKGRKAVLNG